MKTETIKLICFLILSCGILSCQKESDIPENKVPIADAGASQVTKLPADSIRVTGLGTDADGKVVAYLWSEVSGPNKATIVNPGSPSTLIRDLIKGSYVFQLMVVDDKGATGVDTLQVKVEAPDIETLTLQPANNPNEVHIWGNSTNEEGSHNGAPELGASYWTAGGNVVGQRGLFKFDFSGIPANATIVSAKLSLYSNSTPYNGDLINANSGPNNAMLIQRVISSWTASTVKWVNQPTTTTANQVVIPHTSQSFLDLIDINVTDMVQAMVSNNANHGFMIKLQNEVIYNSRIFGSSFYSNASKRPKIVIQFTR